MSLSIRAFWQTGRQVEISRLAFGAPPLSLDQLISDWRGGRFWLPRLRYVSVAFLVIGPYFSGDLEGSRLDASACTNHSEQGAFARSIGCNRKKWRLSWFLCVVGARLAEENPCARVSRPLFGVSLFSARSIGSLTWRSLNTCFFLS